MNIQSVDFYQWLIILVSGLLFLWLAPLAKTKEQFYSALSKKGSQPGVVILTSSLVISWIFAKSITNAANLGSDFGIVGGLAYAIYYLSFIVAGFIIYKMRSQGGFKSIHEFLYSKHGRSAVIAFSILIGIRLFNEVWSNTMVIGSYFGEMGSQSYYGSIIIFTILTLAYTLKGGLSSSLLTDAIQMVFFGLLLFVLLVLILPKADHSASEYIQSGSWTFEGGLNLMFAALIQIFSYPFHDSVMTDRGFISSPRNTLKSFIWASFIGFICLTLFSLIGVYAQFQNLEGQAAVQVSKSLGIATMLMMNFIMITSAASTLDSAFSSFSKLLIIDLGFFKELQVARGRLAMAGLAILGTIPIFLDPEILSATTVSGTMVLGLAPVFIFWNRKTPKYSFHLSVGASILVGLLLATGFYPNSLNFTKGKYADLLSSNVYGSLLCFSLFFLPQLYAKFINNEA